MQSELRFFPEQASTMAMPMDAFYFYLVGVSVFFTVLIFTLVVIFAIKYRRRPGNEVGQHIEGSRALEVIWTGIPLILVTVMFVWGAKLYYDQERAPADSMELLVTGKKWMWKFQHSNGRREINTLHIPIDKPVKLLIGSEDVIHSLFIPAFRLKQDAVPGRLTTMWFEATKPGTFHLFCNQYCGKDHSRMIGKVIAMEPGEFQRWLAGDAGLSPVAAGEKIFNSLGCNTCHLGGGNTQRGPSLAGLAGSTVKLIGGSTVVADDNYIRESIVNPQAAIVDGYQPIMPPFKGLVTEEQVLQLVAYIKSMPAPEATAPAHEGAAPGAANPEAAAPTEPEAPAPPAEAPAPEATPESAPEQTPEPTPPVEDADTTAPQ